MLERRWIARCDESGCEQIIVCDGVTNNIDRWNAGITISDQDWDAAPNRRETYCPEHWHHMGAEIGATDAPA